MNAPNNTIDAMAAFSPATGSGTVENFCAGDARVACPLFQAEYGGSKPTSALQLKISKCQVKHACKLNEMWHSRLPLLDWSSVVRHRFYVCFVAECNNLYYATAIWSEPSAANRMKDGDKLMELRRLAIAPDAPKNTASRMLRVMKDKIAREWPQLLRLISYQDTEAHTGGIYKAAGWKNAAETEFRPWLHHRATDELTQTRAKKVRWEYTLRESPNNVLDRTPDNSPNANEMDKGT